MLNDLHYFLPQWVDPTDETIVTDICIYGGTSAGLIAAVEARRRGKEVIVLQPGKFIGGLTSGGLGFTDYGRKNVIGGLSREFYRRVGKHYSKEEEFQFEPKVAMAVYQDLLREHQIVPRFCQFLDRVEMQGGTIRAITMLGGLRVSAKVFVDATYEGDLMARAGVSYIVGRESNDRYGETLNGIQVRDKHQFSHRVDPFIQPGNAASGLLPGIIAEDLTSQQGKGDNRVQAYCFRMCMTDDPALKIDWQAPEAFDPAQHELVARWLNSEKDEYNDLLPKVAGDRDVPTKFDVLPNPTADGFYKTDTNNHGPVSSDFIGANYDWPEGSYEKRENIFQAHVRYQKGFYWFVANSKRVPQRYRDAFARWGLPRDEFTQTGHWPHQLYIREARRLLGQDVITEHDCRGDRATAQSIGMGSYGMDSHNCTRFIKTDSDGGRVLNEGDVQVGAASYPIPYGAITPKPAECTNLLVPVCLSSSHIAYGSARMEPVFMVLGQSAAVAACIAIERQSSVQSVPYELLAKELSDCKQVLTIK